MKSKIIFIILLISFSSCTTSKIRENKNFFNWLEENIKQNVEQKDLKKGAIKNYLLIANIYVADRTQKGDTWEKDNRVSSPNLGLYYISNDNTKIRIGSKNNTRILRIETPLKLSADQSITLRLVNEKRSKVQRNSYWKYSNDSQRIKINEIPLANLEFDFKGQGKYILFSGVAVFVLEFKEMKI